MRTMAKTLAILMMAGFAPHIAQAALGVADLKRLSSAQRCEQPKPGHVVFAGDSANLGACLKKLRVRDIAELHVTSGGGDAYQTLLTARELLGHVDLVVVRGLCASSCANYLLPMARRVRVLPDSYVILHGSISPDLLRNREDNLRRDLMAQYRALNQKESLNLTEQEMAAKIDAGLADFRVQIRDQTKVQDEFARQTLRCHDWLDPNLHLKTPIPDQYGWLLVTPVMGYRCLEIAKIDDWWPPEPQQELDPKLRFMRARR